MPRENSESGAETVSALTPEIVLRAYAAGLFPMAERRDGPDLHWIDPEVRGVLPLDAFHVPRRLRRTVRNSPWEIRCDTAFEAVIRACAGPRPRSEESWINAEIVSLYVELSRMGRAHSVEVWNGRELAGGLYGVALGAAFFGESMFSRLRDASKIALVHLVARLRKAGFTLLDTQFATDHLATFGVVEIPRAGYRRRLRDAHDPRGAVGPGRGEPASEGGQQKHPPTA